MTSTLIKGSIGIACSIIWSLTAHAQLSSWHYTTPTGYELMDSARAVRWEDVYFTDTLTGFTVNLSGRIGKTKDGGRSWKMFFDGSVYPSFPEFRSIEFLDNGRIGIAGSLNGYTYRTEDAGETWRNISDSIPKYTLGPDDARKICGLGHKGNNFYGVGWWGGTVGLFYKSTDKGVTWTVSNIDPALATSLIDVYFTSADTGFITGGVNVYIRQSWPRSEEAVVLKTTDGGATWRKVCSDSTLGGRIWKIQYVNEHLMVGALEPYYYPDTVNMIRSTDGGNTWQVIGITRFDTTDAVRFTQQGIGFVSPLRGFVGGYGTGMMQTSDGGKTWDTTSFGVHVNRIFVVDSTHAYAGGEYLYRWGRDIDTAAPKPDTLIASNKLYPISPNPTKDNITIHFDIGKEMNVVLEVAGVTMRRGERLMSKRLTPGHYTYRWNGSAYPNGDYIIWLGTDEIPLTQKFVLQR